MEEPTKQFILHTFYSPNTLKLRRRFLGPSVGCCAPLLDAPTHLSTTVGCASTTGEILPSTLSICSHVLHSPNTTLCCRRHRIRSFIALMIKHTRRFRACNRSLVSSYNFALYLSTLGIDTIEKMYIVKYCCASKNLDVFYS